MQNQNIESSILAVSDSGLGVRTTRVKVKGCLSSITSCSLKLPVKIKATDERFHCKGQKGGAQSSDVISCLCHMTFSSHL